MLVCPQCGHSNVELSRFCSRCGALLEGQPSAQDPLIGRLVGDRYRVVRAIGEGGMGRVYLAEQRMGTASRAVAIKVLNTSMADQLAVARFYRECETVVSLSHANTIRFYDFGQLDLASPGGVTDPRLFIAMEYVDGRSLAAAIEEGPLPLAVVDRFVRQIGGALTEAHKRGIVHRDLKPDNVLLARDDVEGGEIPKVCDFGIAKRDQEGAAAEITAQGTIIGTPAYMSPEQISGHAVDERSDVYALALMTYEMLTGARPFVAKTPIEWATAHMTATPRSFDEFDATRSLSLERRAAILRALEKEPDARTPSVRRFVEELCGLTPRATSEPPPSFPRTRDSRPGIGGSDPTVAATPRSVSSTGAVVPRRSGALGPVLAAIAALAIVGAGAATVWIAMGGGSEGAAGAAASDAGEADAGAEDAAIDAGDPSMPDEWVEILQYEDRATDATLALGPPDGRCARIAPGGTLHVELTPGARMTTDGDEGPDLRVIVLPGSAAYRVDVGVAPHQFTTIAQGLVASTPLDVDQYGITRFRYVRVKNRERRGDVCVDAIGAFSRATE